MMFAVLALALASPAPLNDDWREVAYSQGEKATIYVDAASIVERDGKRRFRTKIVQAGNPRYIISSSVLDCGTRLMDTMRMEAWQDGKFVAGEDFPLGKYHYDLAEDPHSGTMIDLVCGAPKA